MRSPFAPPHPPTPPFTHSFLSLTWRPCFFISRWTFREGAAAAAACKVDSGIIWWRPPPEWKASVIGCHYTVHTTTKETPSLDRSTKPGFQQIWKEKVHRSFKFKLCICQRKCSHFPHIFFLYNVDMPGCERFPCLWVFGEIDSFWNFKSFFCCVLQAFPVTVLMNAGSIISSVIIREFDIFNSVIWIKCSVQLMDVENPV